MRVQPACFPCPMSFGHFTQARLGGLLLAMLFFLLGCAFLPYPGLQNDEVLFAASHYAIPAAALWQIEIFHHKIPVMALPYLGELKAWLYEPILSIFRPSYLAVRLPVLILGAVTVLLFFRLVEAAHGRRAAWAGGLLLATDGMFLLTTSFDWGPVALQHFLLLAGLYLVLIFARSSRAAALFFGFFCFGLGMWDKALFLWMLGGLLVATLAVFRRELWNRLTPRNISLAVAGFCAGALPLLAYNAVSGMATFRGDSFVFGEFAGKAAVLRATWNGSALFGYLVSGPGSGNPREAQGAVESAAFFLHSAFGDRRYNQLEPAFYLALALVPLLWRSRARRTLLFCLIALGAAWFQMAITRGAGAAAHHAVLLWPLPQLFLAVAFAEASGQGGPVLRKLGRPLFAAVVLFLAATNLLLLNQYFYQLARFGPAGGWTDAIYGLSGEIGRKQPAQVVVADWGLLNPLALLQQGKLNMAFAGEQFLSPAESEAQKAWDRGLLERGLWMGHTDDFQIFPGVNNRIAQAAATAGYRKEVIEVIPDRHGRSVFEIYRFLPAR